jgi:hypothetical protein
MQAARGHPQALRLARAFDAPLALAVIAVAAVLRMPGCRRGDRGGISVSGGRRGVGRGRAAQLLAEALLAQPVLRHFQRARAGAGSRPPGEGRERCRRARSRIRRSRRRRPRRTRASALRSCPIGAGEPRATSAATLSPRARRMAAIAELRRGHRHHPAELAAAEDADGGAGRGSSLVLVDCRAIAGRSPRRSVCAARQA